MPSSGLFTVLFAVCLVCEAISFTLKLQRNIMKKNVHTVFPKYHRMQLFLLLYVLLIYVLCSTFSIWSSTFTMLQITGCFLWLFIDLWLFGLLGNISINLNNNKNNNVKIIPLLSMGCMTVWSCMTHNVIRDKSMVLNNHGLADHELDLFCL